MLHPVASGWPGRTGVRAADHSGLDMSPRRGFLIVRVRVPTLTLAAAGVALIAPATLPGAAAALPPEARTAAHGEGAGADPGAGRGAARRPPPAETFLRWRAPSGPPPPRAGAGPPPPRPARRPGPPRTAPRAP
ncbi:hypothetical protein GPN2_13486 [Streptomyces murinus]